MRQSDLQPLLIEFSAERLALLERHEASARVVSHYDFNNAYQYVINREETHLQWLQTALAEFGAPLPPPSPIEPVPAIPDARKKDDATRRFQSILSADARLLDAFIEKWRPRVDATTHARHRKMLDVVLGESREHQRVFEQAAAGMEDVLGRRTGGVPRRGSVLPVRWKE